MSKEGIRKVFEKVAMMGTVKELWDNLFEWLEEIEERINSINPPYPRNYTSEKVPSCKDIIILIESILSLKTEMVGLKDAIDNLRTYKTLDYMGRITELENKIKELKQRGRESDHEI